jgi:thymidylate kinase
VLAWLDEGRAVLCARYLAYSFAWHLDHVDLDWLQQINARCRVPDLTLFLDVEPDAATANLERNYRKAIDALQDKGHDIVIVDGRDAHGRLFEYCCRHIAAL